MKNFFAISCEAEIYALLRVVAGFLFLWHGSQKLFGFPSAGFLIPLSTMVIVAGSIEIIGGILIMAGLWTRWAALIVSGEMAFAYWLAHGTKALLPIVNQGEIAVLYCFLFLYIFARGSGMFSLDDLIRKRREKP